MYNLGKVREVKRNKRILTIAIICIVLILALIIILPNILLKYVNKDVLSTAEKSSLSSILNKNYNDNNSTDDMEENKENKKFYNLIDLVKYYTLESSENVVFNTSSNVNYVIDNEKYIVDIALTQKADASTYTIEYGIGEDRKQETLEDTKQIQFELNKEGKNDCYIEIKKDGNILDNGQWNKDIYKINSYKKQYLDELEKKGVGVHIIGTSTQKFLPIYKALGSQYIRVDLRMDWIYKNNKFTFSTYESNINELLENKVNILAILGGVGDILGDDQMVSSNEELELFSTYIDEVAKKFPKIKDYEIWNEPNALYKEDDQIAWYAKVVQSANNILKSNNKENNILIGVNSYGNKAVYPTEFMKKVSELGGYKNSNLFSYHIYDFSKKGILNRDLKKKINENDDTANELGGFIRNTNTEFGGSTYTYSDGNDSLTIENQAEKIVQQYVLSDKNNIEYSLIYNIRDSGSDINEKELNFGMLDCDYNPKSSYYSTKNYYENINGAKYIGEVILTDGLEFHIYDKDGKPKVVAWSNDTNKNITIPYQGFTAKDIYGNDIQADETGNINITTSPVYLDNISRKYFYQAISNTMKEKNSDFETKFTEEISKVNGLSEKLQKQKQIAEDIGNHNESSEIAENTAIQYMKDFYAIGNTIIDEYRKGTLDIEYVKLSSMLDSLNDIGNSYEDLVTITAQTRNANFEETNKKIETAEDVINNGKDLDNIYPSKVLDFAKEFNEKATYINNLDEENDIKTGLIVSKNLHANLLADWAKQFADVYIDKYLQENPVQEVTYSTEDGQEYQIENITNKSVTATLPTTDDMQITSEGGNTHTFEQNDSFTFKYTRKGRNFEVVVNVENIDKDAPIITGVENNKLYTSQVSVNVEDKNLKDVKVICNDEEIKYDLNTPLKEEGIYEIEATDKAENTTKKVFQLIENASEDYNVGDEYITNIHKETTSKELREKLLPSVDYDIKRDDEILSENETIRTGDTIETKDMHQKYTLIVAGDINKNGEVDIRDFIRLRKYLLGQVQLDDLEKLAADANVDNKEISKKDFIRMKIIILSN